MENYKVIDPKGITLNGELVEKGGNVSLGKGAELNAFLHFNQVELAKPEKEKPEAPSGK